MRGGREEGRKDKGGAAWSKERGVGETSVAGTQAWWLMVKPGLWRISEP